MKHLLIILSILLLSSPVIGQETGVLFFREVNDKWGWFEDGNKDKDVKYIGEFKDGTSEDRQPNGQGTITYPNGRKYVGEYKDGERDGQGTLTWSNGKKYLGEWKNGEMSGQGTKTWTNGDMYEGEFKDGKYDGQGTYTWSDGRKYVGEFKDGETKRSWYCHVKGWDVCPGMEGE